MAGSVLSLFLEMVCVGVTYVILSFLGHTYLLFAKFVLFFYLRWPHVASSVLCLLLVMVWVGLRSLIVAFPGHTKLLFIKFVLFSYLR